MPKSIQKKTKKRTNRAKAIKLSWKQRLQKINGTAESTPKKYVHQLSDSAESTNQDITNSSLICEAPNEVQNFSQPRETCFPSTPSLSLIKTCTGNTSFATTGILTDDETDRINQHQLDIEIVPRTESPIQGNRIVELGYVLEWAVCLQYNHSKICTLGKLSVAEEIRRGKGLTSTIIFQCNLCDRRYSYDTENPNKPKSVINTGAVWGTLATGSSYEHMKELISCMDIPPMNGKLFYDLEAELGKEWEASLYTLMEMANTREKEIAIEKRQICADGTPWITVYVDGSWSKRSYGTNYNALSGMAAIIGKNTGELLYVGVRNKYCSICARAQNKNETPKNHLCFKNWTGTAPAMESDIIVDGFNSSESFGLRYLKFIGEGDSSVFAKIQQLVSYGKDVKKVECLNHCLKNYGKRLRNTKADTQISLKGRKLFTIKKLNLLVKRAKCTIYDHAKKDANDMNLLKEDLRNGLHHVFGDHVNCRQEICNTPGEDKDSLIPELKQTLIYNHIRGNLDLLVRKSHLLIENENNNRAERLMNIVSRFNAGKRLNFIQRGSYQRRVCLSALRHNNKFSWHYSPYKCVTGTSPGKYFKAYINEKISKQATKSRKRLFADHSEDMPKKKLKITPTNKVLNTDYGPNADEPEDESMVITEVEEIVKRLTVTEETCQEIEAKTVGQFGNDFFEQERRHRLTASMFGRVIKRRPHTPCHTLVKACLKTSHFWSQAIEFGITKEKVALALFENKSNLKVRDSGLWVDVQNGFLGASPDGVIESENALVEIKCLFSASKLQLKANTWEEIIELLKNKICLENKNGRVQLKRNHIYYYQVQGQLNIAKKEKCYFITYVNDTVELFIEEIKRDKDVWNKMVPMLTQFYMECIGPEIVRNYIDQGKKCKDPPFIEEAISAFWAKKAKKNTAEKNKIY